MHSFKKIAFPVTACYCTRHLQTQLLRKSRLKMNISRAGNRRFRVKVVFQ